MNTKIKSFLKYWTNKRMFKIGFWTMEVSIILVMFEIIFLHTHFFVIPIIIGMGLFLTGVIKQMRLSLIEFKKLYKDKFGSLKK